jgi:hypothetical protein
VEHLDDDHPAATARAAAHRRNLFGLAVGLDGRALGRRLGQGKSGVIAAYDRTSMVGRRGPVMQQWSDFLDGQEQTAEVVPLFARR